MSKRETKIVMVAVGFLTLLILWTVLPPAGWAILGLVALSYGLCWVAERAIRKAWRR